MFDGYVFVEDVECFISSLDVSHDSNACWIELFEYPHKYCGPGV